MLGIVFPVRGHVQHAAGLQLALHQGYPGGLDDAALVVLFLVPGVGEIELHPGQAVIRDAQLENLHRVIAVAAQVAQSALLDFHQQGAHARAMHFNTDKVLVRIGLGHIRQGVSHAIADFQHPGHIAAKYGLRVQHAVRPLQAKLWPEIVQGVALSGGKAAFAQHKAAYLAHDLAGFRVFILFDEVEHGIAR